jgi:glycine cleavage system regulatory protein
VREDHPLIPVRVAFTVPAGTSADQVKQELTEIRNHA